MCAVDDCGRAAYCRGFCTRHYQRFKKHGDPLIGGRPSRLETLTRHIRVESPGCWIWTGYIDSAGYGRTHDGLAHRVVWTELAGEIPEGWQLDHLCRVTACVNPDHLEPVPPRINVLRSSGPVLLGRRNRAKTHCPQGHAYDAQNTSLNKAGARQCRTCRKTYLRAYKARKRAEIALSGTGATP